LRFSGTPGKTAAMRAATGRRLRRAGESGLNGTGVVLGLGADRIVTQAGNWRASEKLHTDPNAASPNDAAAAVKLFVGDR